GFGIGLFLGELGCAVVVLGPSLVQLGTGGFQLGFGGVKGGESLGVAGVQGQLAFQHLQLHFPQGGFRLGHQLLVGKVGGGDQPLGVHLPLALVQLGLVAGQLVVSRVVEGLGAGQDVPQLDVIDVVGLGFFQGGLGVVEDVL